MTEVPLSELEQALRSIAEDERYRAVVTAARLGWRETRAIAGAALGDTAWRVRKAAVAAVAQWGPDDEAWQLIYAGLADADNAGRRNAALELIERLGDRLLPRVIALTEDASPHLRKFAVDALLARPSSSAVPALLRRVDDSDANVRGAAVEALSRVADERAVAALLRVIDFSGARDPLERLAALRGLEALGAAVERRSLEPLLPDPLLRNAALRLLARCPGPSVIGLLVDAIEPAVPSATAAAVSGLCEIGTRDPQVRMQIGEQLRRRLQWARPALRAVYGSEAAGMAQAVATLTGWLGDAALCADLFVDRRARWIEAELRGALAGSGAAAARAVIDRLPEMEPDDQRFALEAVADLVSAADAAPVARLLESAIGRVAVAAAHCLARAADVDTATVLIGRLADPDAEIALASQQALQALVPHAADRLRAGLLPLFDPQPATPVGLRALTIWPALARIEDAPLLRRLATHASATARALALRALAAIELPATERAQHVRIALTDEAAEVRLAAIEALVRRDLPDAVEMLQRALADPSPLVRAAVLERLATIAPDRAGALLAIAVTADPVEARAAVLAGRQLSVEARRNLWQRAVSSPQVEVLLALAEVLPDLEPDEIPALLDALLDVATFEVRHATVSRCGSISRRWPGLRPLLRSRLNQVLEAEPDGFVHEAALAALAALTADGAV